MIGLIGAMAVEMEALLGRLEHRADTRIGLDTFSTGTLCGKEAVLAVCGPGKVNAALCAHSMILTFRPEWVLNLGVAGAGDETVSVGDMVIATCAVEHDLDYGSLGDPRGYVCKLNRIQLPCDEALRNRLYRAASRVEGLRVVEGVIATGDQFINDAARREAIHAQFGAKAVEMEGGAIAHACGVNGIPCGIIRSISDGANGQSDMDFPAFAALAAKHSQEVVMRLLEDQTP